MNYIKKIGLDLRFLKKDDYYSQFIYELIGNLIKETPEYFYNIYLDLSFANLNFGENSANIFPKAKFKSLREQTHLSSKMKKDKNDLIIFFNYNKPINYRGKYIVFIANLSNLHFPKKTSFIKKHIDDKLFNNTCKNADKIICFNKNVKEELNDKLNINEEKIKILKPFFKKENNIINENIKNLTLNLETKYNIKGEYIIYNSGTGTEKNLDKLIEVFKKIKENNIEINLVILDNDTIKDLHFRQQVIDNKLTDKIFFIGNIDEYEKEYFYKNSLGLILPSLYIVFPFCLTKALNYGINILASELDSLKNIFQNKITYFNQNNIDDIYEKIIKIKKTKNDYFMIFEKYNINKSIEDLKNIIK